MTYTLSASGVIRDSDGANIPNDPRNADWQQYQTWITAGNTPQPMPPLDAPIELRALDLLALFTPSQQDTVIASTDIGVCKFRFLALAANNIHLADPRVAAGLDACISAGIITADDKTRILANLPPV